MKLGSSAAPFAMVSLRRAIGCSYSVLSSTTGAADGFPLLPAKSDRYVPDSPFRALEPRQNVRIKTDGELLFGRGHASVAFVKKKICRAAECPNSRSRQPSCGQPAKSLLINFRSRGFAFLMEIMRVISPPPPRGAWAITTALHGQQAQGDQMYFIIETIICLASRKVPPAPGRHSAEFRPCLAKLLRFFLPDRFVEYPPL
jgi:hypothetical protein